MFVDGGLDAAFLIGGGLVEVGFEATGDVEGRVIEAPKEELFGFGVVESNP
jgi:hypothetical protein